MLRIDSFVHRQQLAELITRWMLNRPRSGDVRQLKTIVNFNLYCARIWLDDLTTRLLRELHSAEPTWHPTQVKGAYKDFAVRNLRYTSPRIEQMCDRYLRFPEDFYRETPVDGGYYTVEASGQPSLVACTRIKRFRRIAEKGGRRIVDDMLRRIRESADQLAEERARSLGVDRRTLVTPPEKMAEEFAHAERRVIKRIKQGTIARDLGVQSIPDVVGVKLILEDHERSRLLPLLEQFGCRVDEVEEHRGVYNATNMHVALPFPKAMLAARPPSGRFLTLLHLRGFEPERVLDDYLTFLTQADDEVSVEIIVSSFQEYLESEIGRAMHEERVLSQRRHPDYNGNLGMNIRFLMEFILSLCRAPGLNDVHDVPIKLWVKYMPDTVEQLVRSLYLDDDHFFDTVPERALES
ncbi:MAG: hypothetical protein ABIJ09_09360 [Pseudomonadota bacterium]